MPDIIYTRSFSVTGSANSSVYDAGVTSTEAEKKKLLSVLIDVSDYQDNIVEGWLEREKVVDIYDKVLSTSNATGTNIYRSTNKVIEIPVNLDIPVGQTFKIAIKSGGTATNLRGAYKYQLI